MKTYGTYLINDKDAPIRYGEINLINPKRQKRRGLEKKDGVEAYPVFCGFCGTDYELMKMGERGALNSKFPLGEKRLINGHEGIVWVPGEKRFAIVLIRGGDSFDPTRFTEDETYFEYGCHGADGIFCDKGYFHPDMLLPLPNAFDGITKLPLSLAKKLVFSDPYACAVFQYERMCDIGAAQNFRVIMAKTGCCETDAREHAVADTFKRTVLFGLGTTGLFIGDQIRRHHPEAQLLFVARSEETSQKANFVKKELQAGYLSTHGLSQEETAQAICARIGGTASVFVGTSGTAIEHKIAFENGVLGCNGIYNSFSLGPTVSFDTMPFGFQNHVILSSINFTEKHMREAIKLLAQSRYDQLVELIGKPELIQSPANAYTRQIYAKGAPLKTAVVWNEQYIDREK